MILVLIVIGPGTHTVSRLSERESPYAAICRHVGGISSAGCDQTELSASMFYHYTSLSVNVLYLKQLTVITGTFKI